MPSPRLNLIAPLEHRGSNPIAVSTCDGSEVPDAHADPVDTAIPNVGIGARMYLTRRFLIRADYRNTVVFTDDDDSNENIDEWKIGIGFFF